MSVMKKNRKRAMMMRKKNHRNLPIRMRLQLKKLSRMRINRKFWMIKRCKKRENQNKENKLVVKGMKLQFSKRKSSLRKKR
jgi:hypothetical protein